MENEYCEIRVRKLPEAICERDFLLLKATETKCPYRSRGGYAWAVVGKIGANRTPAGIGV